MILELDGLTHRYDEELAVTDVSFGVDSGELVALLGPSGCGKTTIVQTIAGHVRPTAGRVSLRGRDVTDEPPETREVGLMFQRSTLYPHMTVAENVEYGLAGRNNGRTDHDALVSEYLDLVDLGAQRTAYPSELSGGQKRRVELARALAPQPDMLLLDEPLSALDRTLREQLREEIARIQRETGVTTLYVTHDQEEAMALADRLVVMNDGRVSGIGAPRSLYESPPTSFVASFLGGSNTLSATVVETQPLTIDIDGQELTLGMGEGQPGQPVLCHVRPENLTFQPTDRSNIAFPGDVRNVTDLGRRFDVTVRIESGDELAVGCSAEPPAVGECVTVWLSERDVTIFDRDSGKRLAVDATAVST